MTFYRFAGTPWGVGLQAGLVFGAVFGLATGLVGGSLWAGVLVGDILAVVYAVVWGAVSKGQLEHLAGLSGRERAAVVRTARKGLETTDRRLAPGVIGFAGVLRERNQLGDPTTAFRICAVLAAVMAVLAVLAALEGEWFAFAFRSAGAVAGLLTPRWVRQRNERLDRATQSAQALLT